MPRPARPLLAVLLALALGAGPVGAGGASGALDRLERGWLDHLLATRPEQATALGRHERDGALVPVTRGWLDAEQVWLRDFARRLDALPDSALAPARALDRDVLARRIALERFDLDERRVWERDPARVLEQVGLALDGVLARPRMNPCGRATLVTKRLRLVPEALRAAEVLLAQPSTPALERALDQAGALLVALRIDVPARTDACHDGATQAALAEADTAAVRALADYAGFLRESARGPGAGEAALGRERLERLWRLSCAPGATARLEDAAAWPFGAIDAGAGADRAGCAPLDSVRALLAPSSPRTRATDVEVRVRPGWRTVAEPLSAFGPGPFDGADWLVVEVDDARLDCAAAARPLLALELAAARADAALSRGRGGRAAPSATRRAALSDAYRAGWGAMAGAAAAAGDSDRVARARRMAAWIAVVARPRHEACAAGLAFHASQAPFDSCVARLESGARLSHERAVRLMRDIAVDPAPFLGAWVALRLEEERWRWADEGLPARDFDALVDPLLGAPVEAVREAVGGAVMDRRRARGVAGSH